MAGIFLKKELRKKLLAQRRSLSTQERQQASQQVFEQALKIPQIFNAKCLGVYWSHGDELDLRPLWQHCLAQNKQVCFPRVDSQKRSIEFAPIQVESELQPGTYGILEPQLSNFCLAKNKIEAVLIPGLAFDFQGNRLGWGKGYFDQWLKDFNGFRLGVAYDFQVMAVIPYEVHDEKVHGVLTDQRLLMTR